ncbi:hypothetical protein NQ317_002767 [Molorchus minor]|uniref:Uncharacterized protein n=1 Tax=Molorchus minor TaxID=1323400 RepID=A0ABQ9IYS9_9CUCU|nr:hypothetical protein NQ317_002767 [Molorchus minor]
MKQFDAAANVNNWLGVKKATALIVSLRGDALEILQTLNEVKHKNNEDISRNQKMNENLQQYEADITSIVYLAHPTSLLDFIEQLAVQVFIDGIQDFETQQVLRLARCKNFNEYNEKKSQGPQRTTRTPENIERVREALNRSPSRSARKHASELNINREAVRRILHKDLKFHPYKLQIVQQLKERDFEAQLPLPFDLCFEHPEERADIVKVYSSKLATRIYAIHDEPRKKLKFGSNRLKTRYDARSNNRGYQAVDEVWLNNPTIKKEDRPNSRSHGKALIILLRESTIWFIESNENPRRK